MGKKKELKPAEVKAIQLYDDCFKIYAKIVQHLVNLVNAFENYNFDLIKQLTTEQNVDTIANHLQDWYPDLLLLKDTYYLAEYGVLHRPNHKTLYAKYLIDGNSGEKITSCSYEGLKLLFERGSRKIKNKMEDVVLSSHLVEKDENESFRRILLCRDDMFQTINALKSRGVKLFISNFPNIKEIPDFVSIFELCRNIDLPEQTISVQIIENSADYRRYLIECKNELPVFAINGCDTTYKVSVDDTSPHLIVLPPPAKKPKTIVVEDSDISVQTEIIIQPQIAPQIPQTPKVSFILVIFILFVDFGIGNATRFT